jgi:hypothetical protein
MKFKIPRAPAIKLFSVGCMENGYRTRSSGFDGRISLFIMSHGQLSSDLWLQRGWENPAGNSPIRVLLVDD